MAVQLERELTTMRSNGVDLRAKQAEVDAAKRRAEEAHEALIAAEKCAHCSVNMPYCHLQGQSVQSGCGLWDSTCAYADFESFDVTLRMAGKLCGMQSTLGTALFDMLHQA